MDTNIFNHSKACYSALLADYTSALQTIQILEEEVNRLKEQIALMQQRKFGKKSESNVGEPTVDNQPLENVQGYTRRKGNKTKGRLLDLSKLLRHKFYHS